MKLRAKLAVRNITFPVYFHLLQIFRELAMKYGYDSPNSFTRAFQTIYGVTLSKARTGDVQLKPFERISFSAPLQNDMAIQYRIEVREGFEMFGVYSEISIEQEKAFIEVPQFCMKCDDDGSVDAMNELLGRFHDTWLHAALYDFTDTKFKYMLCYYLPKSLKTPDAFTKLHVPAATWVIFTALDCDIQNLWRRIWSEWFLTSEYEQTEGPQFEMYYGNSVYCFGEIWIPIKKKRAVCCLESDAGHE